MMVAPFRFKIAALLSTLALGACAQEEISETPSESAVASCDRNCLTGLADSYVNALVDGAWAKLPFSPDVAFVENLERLNIGEGLWQVTTGPKTEFSVTVPDPVLQQVGWLGVIERQGEPVVLALRLKLENNQITEVEHIVTPPAFGNMANLQTVRPGWLTAIPADQRLKHEDLLRIGATYYDALDDNDGSKAPFAPECERHENGMITAGKNVPPPPNWQPGQPRVSTDCAKQLDSQSFLYVDRIDNRRMVAADPETGLAMGFSHFRHSLENVPYTVINSDGSTSERTREQLRSEPFDVPAAHVFKIAPDGKIYEIEAAGATVKYDSPTGWE